MAIPGSGGPAEGRPVSTAKRPKLTTSQEQRRRIRAQIAKANGLAENVAFYGPNADARAQALLRGGSGIGAGLGAARHDPRNVQLARKNVERAIKGDGPRLGDRARKGGRLGAIVGVDGELPLRNIRQFQQFHGLPVTGKADHRTVHLFHTLDAMQSGLARRRKRSGGSG